MTTTSAVVTCVRRLTFEAGHSVYGHNSGCQNMHGHSYKVFIHASSNAVDDLGMVVDFKFLKARFGTWIDKHWDHAFIFYREDPRRLKYFSDNLDEKSYALPMNPTAENLALFIKDILAPDLIADLPQVKITKVQVHETENCFAEV